jgi:D-Tyr-tRNAtyr deacylase
MIKEQGYMLMLGNSNNKSNKELKNILYKILYALKKLNNEEYLTQGELEDLEINIVRLSDF